MSNSVQPHRWQPTSLLCPQDSLGKNTGVGCHFLLCKIGEAYSTNSTILKEHVLKELSPRGGSSWSEFLSSEWNVPHTCLIEGPGLGPPYKPHSLSHPRPGRSETRRGKQVFLIRAPGGCLAPASLGIPGAEYRVFFSRLFW